MKVPIIRGHAYSYAKNFVAQGQLEKLGFDASLNTEEVKKILKSLFESIEQRHSELDGIPMPYAFRIFATMNIYDRAQLYRIGYALQRRFAYLYVPTPFEDVAPRLATESVDRIVKGMDARAGKVFEKIYNELSNISSPIVSTAIKEMSRDMSSDSLLENDYSTAPIPTPAREEVTDIARNALQAFDQVNKLVAHVYSVALTKLRIELGVSTLVDVLKLFIASFLSSPKEKSILKADEIADLVLSSLVLPQLSVVVPRARSELLVFGSPEESATYNTLINIRSSLKEALGEETLSAKVLSGFEILHMQSY